MNTHRCLAGIAAHGVVVLCAAAVVLTWSCAEEPFTAEEFAALSPPVAPQGGQDVTAQVNDAGGPAKDVAIPCGNGICGPGEDCTSCPVDCKCGSGAKCQIGTCVPDVNCGDGICGPSENCGTCETDCKCGNGTTCFAGSCGCKSNFCEDAGHADGTWCKDDSQVTCTTEGACRIVANDVWCPKGCSNNACVECKCSPGSTECNGAYLNTCKQDCSGWALSSCSNGCLDGKCKSCVCSAEEKTCDNGYLKTCKPDCSGWSSSYCQDGCANGACKSCVCKAYSTKCDGASAKTCKSDCSGWSSSYCQNGCANGACKSCACTANSTKCDGSFAQTCKSDCSGWSSKYCGDGCVNGGCKTCSCTPGEKKCSGGTVKTCQSDCQTWGSTFCGSGKKCVSGTCVNDCSAICDGKCGTVSGCPCGGCPSGSDCVSQTCKKKPCLQTCNGCCVNETCYDGTATNQCGQWGAPCTSCSSGKGCFSNKCLQCQPNATCCTSGGEFKPKNYKCGSSVLDTEYKCSGSGSGSDVLIRKKYQGCKGGSASCSSLSSYAHWTNWSTHLNCNSSEKCDGTGASTKCVPYCTESEYWVPKLRTKSETVNGTKLEARIQQGAEGDGLFATVCKPGGTFKNSTGTNVYQNGSYNKGNLSLKSIPNSKPNSSCLDWMQILATSEWTSGKYFYPRVRLVSPYSCYSGWSDDCNKLSGSTCGDCWYFKLDSMKRTCKQ